VTVSAVTGGSRPGDALGPDRVGPPLRGRRDASL